MFKGGTCLMLCHGLDRFSEDLDFNVLYEQLDIKDTLEKIKNLLLAYNIIIDYKIEDNKYQDTTIYFYGPLYKETNNTRCKITVDFSRRNDYIKKNVVSRVNHSYNEFPVFYINTLDIDEILAEKIRAIITREKARDVYDLYFLLAKNTKISLELINKKLELYNTKFNLNKFIEALGNKEKIWETELPQLILNVPEFKEVKKEIITKLKSSF
jgi:predicted nucleotidyltransferase component of viral defense system